MNALEKIIRNIIESQGQISLAAFMELALQHPLYGYYRVREPIGRVGDFITAPEVSQMFGEMVGVWCAETWRQMGKPTPFALAELGPGRGTMMKDILRATKNVGGFLEAKKLYLLDSSQILSKQQDKVIPEDDVYHIEDVLQLPKMPTIIVANEFFDSLPVRQFTKTFRGWTENMVSVANNELVMTSRNLGEDEYNLIDKKMFEAKPGTIVELSAQAQNLMGDIARHIVANVGAMLMIDYGYVAPSGSATLQAISNHSFADIFERPGEVDLTAHVDFTSLSVIARAIGAKVSPVIGQGEFLKNLGIKIRADSLKKHATLPQSAQIDASLHRLIDIDQMGQLFKVMSITSELPAE